MNIIVGKNSGFCAGVKNTITKAEKALAESSGITYCLGEIIHNKQVVNNLEKKGLKIINSLDEAKNKLIIRSHGVSKEIYELANKKNITLIDLTCPNVLQIHNKIDLYSKKGFFVFLYGIKDHPESIGNFSFCNDNSYFLENKCDIDNAISKFKSSNLNDLLIISQTTFSVSLFDEMTNIILNDLGSNYNIQIEKSICHATSLRQLETQELSSKSDLMIIIGGKNSSNTKKLYEIAKANCTDVLSVETKEDLDLNFVKNFENIGIMAGASTPRIYYRRNLQCL